MRALPALFALATSLLSAGPKARPVREERFVSIGGIEQWVTIKGADAANPVILFLHGGPGNPLSPFADAVYGPWEKDFTLVQWDQRAAGRTYGRNPPPAGSGLTLERMTEDGVQVAEYLTRRLGKKKVILMGGSWGSLLGVSMAKARPDLFYAYVGISQLVPGPEEQAASYAKVMALAKAAGDADTVSKLEALGAPPWTNPRGFGIVRRATRKYEAKTATPAPSAWWVPAPAYDTPADQEAFTEGEDFSYLQFVGLKGDGILSKADPAKLGGEFQVPVFLVQGAEDLVTVPEVGKRYFDALKAPQKGYVLVPAAGHDPNTAMVEAEYRVLKERVLPLAR